jgi:hypothetical protein
MTVYDKTEVEVGLARMQMAFEGGRADVGEDFILPFADRLRFYSIRSLPSARVVAMVNADR